jgi:nitronate monooxygenase
MMATRFINTQECLAHDRIKQEFIKRQETDTTLICKSLNLQGRALKNRLAKTVLESEARGVAPKRSFPCSAVRGQKKPG